MKTTPLTDNRARMARERRGFTLIEVLVAIGAIGLLSVGIAQVFKATSDTVRVGRRLSSFNNYQTIIERQLREDFSRMDPDSFIFIRHEKARAGSLIPLTPNDPNPRQRRVDQIVFFTNGSYVSQRDPLSPDIQAKSNEARMYYGHGAKRDPDSVNYRDAVNIADDNRLPRMSPGFEGGPNRYAADWDLLRFPTLLAPVRSTPRDAVRSPAHPDLATTGGAYNQGEFADSDVQISLQPAAASIFIPIANYGGFPSITDADLARDESFRRPKFGSGVVDIATTSLDQVRSVVLGVAPGTQGYPLSPTSISQAFVPGLAALANQQYWMQQALPCEPRAVGGLIPPRMRYERTPPDLLGEFGVGYAPVGSLQRDIQRTDQRMLSSFIMAPRCTEFIVEWSFGVTQRNPGTGERDLRWHGLPRYLDFDRDGSGGNFGEPLVAAPYTGVSTGTGINDAYGVRYLRKDGSQGARKVAPELIHAATSVPFNATLLDSYFGYVDPTYAPVPGSTDPDFVQWARPKLIRITLRLVDPGDPLFEKTYQFVFDVPDSGHAFY